MLSWEHGGVKVATERVATMRASNAPASNAQGQLSSQAGGYSMAAGQVSRGHVGAASASIPASMPMPMPMHSLGDSTEGAGRADADTWGETKSSGRTWDRGSSAEAWIEPAGSSSVNACAPCSGGPITFEVEKTRKGSVIIHNAENIWHCDKCRSDCCIERLKYVGGSASSGPRDESTFANGPQLSVYTVTEQNIESTRKCSMAVIQRQKSLLKRRSQRGGKRLRERTKWKAGDSCAICMRGAITGRCKPCSHRSMCEACYQEYKEEDRGVFCPICFEEVNILLSDSVASISLESDDDDDNWGATRR